MEKVACYCRVSTNSRDQANSLENQRSYFEEVLGKNPHYELVKIYADRGISGTSLYRRPEFNQMLIEAGLDIIEVKNVKDKESGKVFKKIVCVESGRVPKFNRIFVKNTSRFARNILVIDILRTLRNKGVYVDFLDLTKSTEDEDNIAFIQMFLVFDENDSRDKSKKVRWGQEQGARRGVIFTNDKLYGYRYIDKTLEIIPEEAAVIKRIFKLYSEGFGIRRILQQLEENGIRTRAGKPFSKSTIRKILQNEKYCGRLVRNKYDTGTVFQKNTYAKIRPKDEWYIHEGKTPQIISTDLFEKCERLMESKINYLNQKGIFHGTSEFAGKIYCAKCGKAYTRNKDRGVAFYNCSTKKTKGNQLCDNKNISETDLNIILEQIRKVFLPKLYSLNTQERIKFYESYKALREGDIDKDCLTLIANKKRELNDLKEKMNKIVDLYLEGQFDKEYLSQKQQEIDSSIKITSNEIDQLKEGNEGIYKDIKKIEEIIESYINQKNKTNFNRQDLLKEINNFCILGDTMISINFKIDEFGLLEGGLSQLYVFDKNGNRFEDDFKLVLLKQEYPYLESKQKPLKAGAKT